MKILFAFYPLYVKYNYGVALLSSICQQSGIQTDLAVLDNELEFLSHLEKFKPDYVGFSAVIKADYLACLPYIQLAKIQGCKVLLGGVYSRRVQISNPNVDYICRGEAEILPNFLLNGDTSVFDSIYIHQDLNNLPLADYELFKNYPFKRKTFTALSEHKLLPYFSSRGCPFDCHFCERHYQQDFPLRYRDHVRNDLDYLKKTYDPDIFFMGDELLPYYNKRWLDAFEGNSHPFACYIRADINTETLKRLHSNGLMCTAFGVESGDENYRNQVLNKNLTDQQLFATLDLLNKLNIQYIPFFMVGTPGETSEIREKTFKLAEKISSASIIWNYDELNPSYDLPS